MSEKFLINPEGTVDLVISEQSGLEYKASLLEKFVFFNLETGDLPLVCTAIHEGHELSNGVREIIALDEVERLREEDPFTGFWTAVTDKKIIAHYSRFQADLNRPREKAVYLESGDAWGLNVWKTRPSSEILSSSLEMYDTFYMELHKGLTRLRNRYGRIIVYDLHSYNYRRRGPTGTVADPMFNPEVNVGTGTMVRSYWATIVDRFIKDLRAFNFLGRHLDVRENIKFKGGYFPRWIHENFPGSVCCLSIEFKKFFMDEWSGKPDTEQLHAIVEALKSTVPGVLAELKKLDSL
jgi:N-formylglutamate deformylase